MMKRKELERHLQDVDGFEKPKVRPTDQSFETLF